LVRGFSNPELQGRCPPRQWGKTWISARVRSMGKEGNFQTHRHRTRSMHGFMEARPARGGGSLNKRQRSSVLAVREGFPHGCSAARSTGKWIGGTESRQRRARSPREWGEGTSSPKRVRGVGVRGAQKATVVWYRPTSRGTGKRGLRFSSHPYLQLREQPGIWLRVSFHLRCRFVREDAGVVRAPTVGTLGS
jgi:hypothetical protein